MRNTAERRTHAEILRNGHKRDTDTTTMPGDACLQYWRKGWNAGMRFALDAARLRSVTDPQAQTIRALRAEVAECQREALARTLGVPVPDEEQA